MSRRHRRDPASTNPAVPTTFDDVVSRGMAKDPDDRYGTTGGLGSCRATGAAGRFCTGDPATHPAPSVAARFCRPGQLPGARRSPHRIHAQFEPRRRGWVLPTVIAVAAALILGGIGVRDRHARQQRRPVRGHTAAVGVGERSGAGRRPGAAPDHRTAIRAACTSRGDDGFAATTGTGFASRAGRGTAETSCLFHQQRADVVLGRVRQRGARCRAPCRHRGPWTAARCPAHCATDPTS